MTGGPSPDATGTASATERSEVDTASPRPVLERLATSAELGVGRVLTAGEVVAVVAESAAAHRAVASFLGVDFPSLDAGVRALVDRCAAVEAERDRRAENFVEIGRLATGYLDEIAKLKDERDRLREELRRALARVDSLVEVRDQLQALRAEERARADAAAGGAR